MQKQHVKLANISFCTKEVPIEFTSVSTGWHIRYIDQIKEVIVRTILSLYALESILMLLN